MQWEALTGGQITHLDGVDTRAYPRDFAVFTRYTKALKQRLGRSYPVPAPLTLKTLLQFLEKRGRDSAVHFDGEIQAGRT